MRQEKSVRERPEQMFSQMDRVALDRLAGRDPQRIARNAGVSFDPAAQVFRFPSMGLDLTVESVREPEDSSPVPT